MALPQNWGDYTPDEQALALAYADDESPVPMSFVEFCHAVNPAYQWYEYNTRLADVLQLVADGWHKRVMVYMPPRLGKSTMVSQLFSAYYLYRFPHRWVALGSYGADLAYDMSRLSKANYIAALGSEHTGGETEAVKHWETGKGGGEWAVGVRGPATGRGASLWLIDDPVKDPTEAASETTQRRNIDWFHTVAMTRLAKGGAVVIIQTRYDMLDLSGQLLAAEDGDAPEGWHIVCFPAEYTPPETYDWPATCTIEPDWRTREGETVCPERLDPAFLSQRKRANPYAWNALYQQNPTPREGGMFHRTWFEVVPGPPPPNEVAALARWWDIAATEAGGDYTAGVKMCKTRSGVYYVLDVVRGQWASGERDKHIRQTATQDGQRVRQLGPQDPGAAGKDMARAFTKLLDGYPVSVFTETGSKETRADPLASAAYTDDPLGGRIKIVRGEWNEALLAELAAFPYGTHDDQVDAASGVYNYLSRLKLQPLAKASGTHTIWTG